MAASQARRTHAASAARAGSGRRTSGSGSSRGDHRSSTRTSATPATIRAPPSSCTTVGNSPSTSHATTTADMTSLRPTNDASFAPRIRAAPMPATYGMTAATADSPTIGTSTAGQVQHKHESEQGGHGAGDGQSAWPLAVHDPHPADHEDDAQVLQQQRHADGQVPHGVEEACLGTGDREQSEHREHAQVTP